MQRKPDAGSPLNRLPLAAAVACFFSGVAFPAAAAPLAGAEIKTTIVDKRIFLATPLGGEFPLVYRGSGLVQGDGEGVGLGRYMAPKDSGRWWIEGHRLCQVWTSWYDGEQFCFTLDRIGPGELRWQRDDGLSGSARIEP